MAWDEVGRGEGGEGGSQGKKTRRVGWMVGAAVVGLGVGSGEGSGVGLAVGLVGLGEGLAVGAPGLGLGCREGWGVGGRLRKAQVETDGRQEGPCELGGVHVGRGLGAKAARSPAMGL